VKKLNGSTAYSVYCIVDAFSVFIYYTGMRRVCSSKCKKRLGNLLAFYTCFLNCSTLRKFYSVGVLKFAEELVFNYFRTGIFTSYTSEI
jgi:hypothetical protein